MSKSLPFFKMYPKDFDTDESARLLDMREAGLYLFCLNHSWINQGLPEEPEEIARALKIPYAEFKTAWVRVSRCFTSAGGRLVNRRQEEERNLAIEKSEKARASIRQRYERRSNVGQTYNERTTNGLRDSSTNVDMESRARADFNAVGENGYERTYERSGNVDGSYEERSTNVSIRASESGSVSVSGSLTTNNQTLSFTEDQFEEIYGRHPKKKDRGIACQYLSQLAVDPAEFNRVHLLWCEEWAKEKPQFAPSLASWILDQGWKYPPNGNGRKPPKPSGCPVCKVVPCNCFEQELAREAANGR